MEDCIFCKIAKGEISCDKVYEDEKVLAFLDINPFSIGHTLLIPKKHSKWVWDMEETDYLYLMRKVKFIAGVLKETFNTEWIVECIAGLDVSHSHIHIIPRKLDDGLGAFTNKVLDPKPTEKEFKEIAEKIAEKIKK